MEWRVLELRKYPISHFPAHLDLSNYIRSCRRMWSFSNSCDGATAVGNGKGNAIAMRMPKTYGPVPEVSLCPAHIKVGCGAGHKQKKISKQWRGLGCRSPSDPVPSL